VISLGFRSSGFEGDPVATQTWRMITDLMSILISAVGLIVCYRTNRRGDDKEFIERVMCIGFPITVFAMIILVAVSILYYPTMLLVFKINDTTPYFETAATACFLLYVYWRLNHMIRLASS